MMSYRLFRRIARLTYPWLSLVINLWRIAHSTDVRRQRAQVRFWVRLSRIDFTNFLAIAINLIQPEYWV